MKKIRIALLVVFLLGGVFTSAKAQEILEFLTEWTNTDSSDSAIRSQYFARVEGKETFCTLSEQLDCDFLGETRNVDGFNTWFIGEGDGPERIELQEIEGKIFLLVEDDGMVDLDLIAVSGTFVQPNKPTSGKNPPTSQPTNPPVETPVSTPTPTSEDDDSCGHYGPCATPGPNGPYKCGGG